MDTCNFAKVGQTNQGLTVGDLLTEDQLKMFGYILLPFAIMQTAGGAAQTIGAIRSHWGWKTWADPRTIAAAACLDESTVRRRHLPKLVALKYLAVKKIPSQRGERCEWSFCQSMIRAGYDVKKKATLPRWAALALPEWSYRAVFATVLQRSLATARGSAKGPVPLPLDLVITGNCGRHEWSLTDICERTGLTRESAVRAKKYLLENHWFIRIEGLGKGDELYLNTKLLIPFKTLQEAHQTTRSVMFKKSRDGERKTA